MRKKIQDLVKGKYEYTSPKLIVDGMVKFEVLENETYTGSFSIASETGERIRGLITCTHPYMDCKVKTFDDAAVDVEFTYHAVGIEAGTKDRGEFVIASSSGEYVVAFEALITRFYHDSSIGKVKTLNDFANLAKLNWGEALKVFSSKFFADILDEKSKLLYKGLCYRYTTAHEMEEFLVGIGKKTRIQFSIDKPERNLGRIRENYEDTIRIFKSGWGHLDIQIATDAPFINLKEDHILASHFTGRDTEIPFTVVVDELHAGKNYGTIELRTPFQRHTVEISVQKTGTMRPDAMESAKKFTQRACAILTKKYIEYKMDHISEAAWLNESLEVFDKLIERDPSDRWNFLFKCQFLILQNKAEDAEWILEDAAYGIKDKQSPEWCFVQHLMQQITPKESKKNNLLSDIKQVHHKYKDNMLMFLLLLAYDGTLQTDMEFRYAVIKDYLANNCSPVIYYEAYKILVDDPSLLKEMDETDIRICYWIAKQKLLDNNLISAIMDGAIKVRTFHNRYFWILGRCYKITKEEACVRIICTYLITNNKFGEEYLNWFARGLESKMRIAGICEAYMQSWRRTDGDIPDIVLHYFSTRNLLPAIYKCRLYAYVVRNKDRLGTMLDAYRGFIIPFLEEELKKNHMNDELAEIARYVKTQITPEHWRDINQNCTNVEKVISANPSFIGIAVCQQGVENCQKAPINQSVSYVHLYSDVYQVLFEDPYGYRYYVKDGFRVNKMFPREWKSMKAESVQMEEITLAQEANAMILELEEQSGTIDSLDLRISEAVSQGLDVSNYQEQLLVRMLFTGHFAKDHVSYFRAICKKDDTTQLRDAYCSWFSWRYLCFQEEVPVEVFEYLEYSVTTFRNLNRCCELALFSYLCEVGVKPNMNSWFTKIFDSVLEQGLKLPCFEKLPAEWKRAYFIHDCSYITYTGESGKKLFCRLKITAGGKRYVMSQPALEAVAGFYVVAVRLFADELMDYEFIENEDTILASGSTKLSQNYLKALDNSRYRVLNEALRENQMQFDKMQKYAEMTDMVNHLFQPL